MNIIDIRGAGVYRSEPFHKDTSALTPQRKVEVYEIEFFKEDYEYGYLNNERIEYKKNTVLIARPDDIRQSKKHFSCYFVHTDISDDALSKSLDSLPSTVMIDDEKKYTQIFKNISAAFPADDEIKKISAAGWIMILISELVNDSKELHETVRETPEIQRNAILLAKTYMNINYKYDIKLKDIADSVHMSPNYFHKLFTTACVVSPLSYLTKIRIEKAKSELMGSEKTITDIAERCGFNSYSYFCTVFKAQCGMTPTEFRKSGNKYYNI